MVDYPTSLNQVQQSAYFDRLAQAYWLCNIGSSMKTPSSQLQPQALQSYELLSNNKKLNIDERYLEDKVSDCCIFSIISSFI